MLGVSDLHDPKAQGCLLPRSGNTDSSHETGRGGVRGSAWQAEKEER